MDIEEIEKDIVAHCEVVQTLGWTIRQHISLSEINKTCCALGAVQVLRMKHLQGEILIDTIINKYGFTKEQFRNFIYGFDDQGTSLSYFGSEKMKSDPYYQMGERIREKFIK